MCVLITTYTHVNIMEDDKLLDMSQEILVHETQDQNFPATFSKNIILHFVFAKLAEGQRLSTQIIIKLIQLHFN